jgi:DEAD/DEAH box helicase domain-containing protein
MHTTAFWLHFPAAFLDQFAEFSPVEKQAGLVGLGSALRAMAALLLMSDPRDLGVTLTEAITSSLRVWEPDLFIYDNYPGGVGLSAPLFDMTGKLLSMTREMIAGCGCEAGCPSCVGPPGEIGERGKLVAARVINALLAA